MDRRSFLAMVSAATVGTSQTADVAITNRPRVPGTLKLLARRRSDGAPGNKNRVSETTLRWEVAPRSASPIARTAWMHRRR